MNWLSDLFRHLFDFGPAKPIAKPVATNTSKSPVESSKEESATMPVNPTNAPAGAPLSPGPWLIPAHARPVLSFPWPYCRVHTDESQQPIPNFQGMWGDRLLEFVAPGKPQTILFAADADVDIDGPGGSTEVDPYWQGETSLRWPDGSSVNSREFPGIVLPPPVQKQFGAKLGDFGLVIWAGKLCVAQVYDTGPTRKIGEISIFLARDSGLVKPTTSDHHAAVFGNGASDMVYIVFPGSGPGHAVQLAEIEQAAKDRLSQLIA